MRLVGHRPKAGFLSAQLGAALAALLILGLLVPSAQADYEQVGTFAGTPGDFHTIAEEKLWPEEVQLGAVGGMAVNYTGAGGVPKGTLYAITFLAGSARVARFNPDGSFSEAWTFKGTLGGTPEERCGPEGDPSTPTCSPRWQGGAQRVDVDVDPATGNVYLINSASGQAVGFNRIHAYNADGTKLLAEFGEQAAAGETFAQSPGKLHDAGNNGIIAVSSGGRVYVDDRGPSFSNRLMTFEPQSPGDYEHYVYAGQSKDVTLKAFVGDPSTNAAGAVFVHSEDTVYKFDPAHPTDPPLCQLKFPVGADLSGTVDPLSGEYFSFSSSDKKVHVFSSCDASGKFAETQKFAISPPRAVLSAMAFDPSSKFEPSRPVGVLYAGNPNNEGAETNEAPEGKSVESALGYVFAHPSGAAKFKLTVIKPGTGQGFVRSVSAFGILCGSTCSAEFDEGKEVELKQEAVIDSKFVKWGGTCSGSGTCNVTMSAAKEVMAEFVLKPKFKLSVTKIGTGAGTVTSAAPNTGINCGATCSAEFAEDRVVGLQQSAAAGSEFLKWGGACTGEGACKVTITEAKSVTAEFGPAKPKFKLTVTKLGTGTGTVTSNPAGISCGGTCSAEFIEGKEVELTQSPAVGSEFVQWGGACSGGGVCKVTMSAAQEVSAEFKLIPLLPKFKLSVTKSGTGSGKVTSTPAGIDCGSTCSFEFEEGKEVELKQEASPGSEFKEWSGACTGTGTCKVTMSEAKAVSAVFEPKPTPEFTLTVTVSGEGEVSANSGTISGCTAAGGANCKSPYKEGAKVTLTETPGAGQQFGGWATPQCDESTAVTCLIEVKGDEGVAASFAAPKPKFKLTVSKSGTGTGKVTSTPAGIDCGATCSFEYEEGKEVELKALAEAGSQFTEWTGACSGTGTCKVTMSSAKEVGAEFKLLPKPKFALKVKKTGTGTGKVESTSPPSPKIECGATCEAEFEEGTKVTLTQSATAGSKFSEWTGACTGTGTCEVTMSAAKEVSAKFDLVPKFKLSVSKSGTGAGTVTSTPVGISCGLTCSAEYESGKEVELKEAPEASSEFVKWTGACTGSGSCKVTMSEAKSVGAEFKLLPQPKFTLKVKKTGTGTGKVTSTPIGIECGATCEAEFEEGTKVTLTQSATAGSKFSEWTGACTGSGTCEVTMSAAKEVSARFDLVPKFKLSVSKSGTGAGKVTSTPAGIDCGSTCSFEYEEGKEVELKETPEAGSEFVKWTGACSGTGTCKATMTEARSVTAEFKLLPKPKFKLSVTKSGAGQGTVTSSPAGIDCSSTCSFEYEEGKEVELKATANPGSEFKEWSGACTGQGTCKVTMSAAKSVGARFDLVPMFKLTVSKSGTGEGTVTSTPAGIECGATCSAEYEAGTEVSLEETPDEGSEFKEWTGACTGQGPCQVTMSSAKSVTAVFKANPTYRLLIQKSGTGQGRVTSAPITDIDCGPSCEAKLPAGTEVELTATPSPGSEFFQWSGACSGQGICKVTMDSAKTVHATFKALPSFKLSVIRSGSGTVTSSPAGIDCGSECEHEYAAATALTLTATPARGYRLKGWSGCDSASGPTCTLTINSARSVSASFVLAKCRRGFHKGKVKGKPHCLRTKRHASHRRGARNSLALPVLWS
jgi:NOL1/NOP2/fmu family ribosome biogenesis protein